MAHTYPDTGGPLMRKARNGKRKARLAVARKRTRRTLISRSKKVTRRSEGVEHV